MDTLNTNKKVFDGYLQEAHDAIFLFEIDKATYGSQLVYTNDAAEVLLKGYVQKKAEHSIEGLLGIEQSQLKNFVNEKLKGLELQEDRMLFMSKKQRDYFNISYNIYQRKDTYLVQMSLKEMDTDSYRDDVVNVQSKIEQLHFDKGFIVLVVIKNYQMIIMNYGHEAVKRIKDIILETIGENIKDNSDIRYSERSFLICINDYRNDVLEEMKEIVSSINTKIFEEDINVLCEMKVGISSFVQDKYEGLHEAKYSLHNIYSKDTIVSEYIIPNDETMMTYIINNDLPYAIDRGEMDVVFQGIYNIQASMLYGFEVLVRWYHGKYGQISPANFIPIAEESDYITTIDLWVLKRALEVYDNIDLDAKEDLKLNFNVSPRDFFDPSFVDNFLAIIKNSHVPCENVILELTETLNLTPKKASIEKLKKEGIMIALDDFGTGFSSLSQIKNFNIDFLKIDISFIRDINRNYDNTLITNAILALASSLNISVIAEGVENNEQINFLKSRQCEYIQGFKFHRPSRGERLSTDFANNGVDVIEELSKLVDMDYKKYARYYEYGKLIYLTVDKEGQIIKNSDLLNKTLLYEVRNGDNIQSIIIEGLTEPFMAHIQRVYEMGDRKSFISELVGLRKSHLVSVMIIKNNEDNCVDVFLEDYTDKRDEYAKIKNLYNRYDLIFENVDSAIIVSDVNENIQEWNKSAENIFGYRRNEVIGKNIVQLLVEKEKQDITDALFNRTVSGHETENINENITKSGKRIICRWRNRKLIDENGVVIGVINWVMDITERLKIEEELNTLSTMILQDPASVVLTDIEGHIEFVNDAYVKMVGYTVDELIGNNPSMVSSGLHTKEFYREMWHNIKSVDVWEGEVKDKTKNGDIIVTASRIFAIKNEKGLVHQFACIQRDITSDVDRENLMNEINTTLENQERLSMIGQMAAGIMHEINNPLSFIDINVHALKEMLDEVVVEEASKPIVEELYELAEDLKEGIEGIKNIAAGLKRFTYRSQSNEFQPIDLNDEIKTIITVSKNEYKYYAELLFDEGDIQEVIGDSGKIKQVLLNLIINAVHAIRDRGSNFQGRIDVKTYEDENYVGCDITDNGCGIPKEIHDKIFESFYTTKEKGKGTGLGLSLSKKIIETEHGGALIFESEVGVGTTFTIKLKKVMENDGREENTIR